MGREAKFFLDKTFVEIHSLKKEKVTIVFNLQDHHIYIKKIYDRDFLPHRELAHARHPGLPEVYYVCGYQGKTYVIREYIQGDTLAEILQAHGAMSEEQVADIAFQLTDILIHVHALNVVHRDIKPTNVIIDKNECVKLIDFDAARVIAKEKDYDTIFLGTKGYAPPEQYGFAQTDARSDIFSLGVTLKELLPPDYNGYLLDIFNLCTKIDPDQRVQSAQKLKELLKRKSAQTDLYAFIFFTVLIVLLFLCGLLLLCCGHWQQIDVPLQVG